MTLRDYQIRMYQATREALREHDRVCVQAPTGSGKTAIFSEMVKAASSRGWNTWIVVPRNELLEQASDALLAVGVRHGRISATSTESAAFDVHVVSKDTLTRRLEMGRVKRPPQLMIVDECHLAIDRQIEFARAFDALAPVGAPRTRILGFSATPERLDGRGLSELYQALVLGPTIPELVARGYLSGLRYFCPPIEGLGDVHRRGTEYDEAELEALLRARKVYGNAVEHYRRHADRRPALVFCRSVKAAAETAQRFCDSGYRFENIDGQMTYQRRRALISALRDGQIDGLTSCELITYGLDVPRVECVIMLRPTLSRTLFMQMIGRGLRPWTGKDSLVVLDHVGNLQEFGHPFSPHVWSFDGRERRKRAEAPAVVARLCPEMDFLYCDRPSCVGCPRAPVDGRDPRRPPEVVDADLVEAASPVPMAERPEHERVFLEAQIDHLAKTVATEMSGRAGALTPTAAGAVGELLEHARGLGRDPMWVYWRLSEGRASVNVPLLCEIGRQSGYKHGWAWWKAEEIRKRSPRRAG